MTHWSRRSGSGAEPNAPLHQRRTSAGLVMPADPVPPSHRRDAYPTLDWIVKHEAVVHSTSARSVT